MSEPTLDESLEKAREQAAEANGDFRPIRIKTDSGKVFEVPDANMLDDDQQEAYDALQHEVNQCDTREVTIPAQTITGPDGTTITTESHTDTMVIQPYQKDGERITPSYNIRLAKIFLGDEKTYKAFKEAGGRSNALVIEVTKRAEEHRRRQAADPKSVPSTAGDKAVSDAD